METVINALCIDVDDLSLACYEAGYVLRHAAYEVLEETLAVLVELEGLRISATFFVPGHVVDRSPKLVKTIAEAGHEVAAHGTRHCRVSKLDPAKFREDVRACRANLQALAGVQVDTYKAPMWSIKPPCTWAYDVLIEEGFRVDHSAMPAMKSHLGWPGQYLLPFRYKKELVIIPPTTIKILGASIPFNGGFYLAYVPRRIQRHVFTTINSQGIPFNYYFHPFEHSPSRRNRRLVKYGSAYQSLYAAHAGRYKSYLRWLSSWFAFAPLGTAYEVYLV